VPAEYIYGDSGLPFLKISCRGGDPNLNNSAGHDCFTFIVNSNRAKELDDKKAVKIIEILIKYGFGHQPNIRIKE